MNSTTLAAPRRPRLMLPERLGMRTFPEKWDPARVPDYGRKVAELIRGLVDSDTLQYDPGAKFVGRPARAVYEYLLRNGDRPDPLGIATFGGVRFTDPTGKYRKFTVQLIKELIAYVKQANLRLLWGTGGGPGFPMRQTVRILKEVAKSLGVYLTHAEGYQILADISDEEPKLDAEPQAIMRPQDDLDERLAGLMLPASVGMYYPYGLGGNAECGPHQLANQLGGKKGPRIVGVRLGILLDCPLTPKQCRFGSLPPDTHFFDYVDLARRTMVAMGHAGDADWDAWIRVPIYRDPSSPAADDPQPIVAAKAVALSIIKWDTARRNAGVAQCEIGAMREALRSL